VRFGRAHIEDDHGMNYDNRLARFFYASKSDVDEDQWDQVLLDRLQDRGARYSFVEKIAAGGMKQISRVYDTQVDRFVAMAQLLPGTSDDFYEPFLREACLTARLEHPNIISVYDIGLDAQKMPFFTMELKSGVSLASIIKALKAGDPNFQARYPPEMLLEIFVKICDAMAYAHAQGVAHLDLKPENIQIASFGEVTVCDWGLGRFLELKPSQSSQLRLHVDLLNTIPALGMACGTPGFMAPEQMTSGGVVSYQTDIYALGVILYTMCTLTEPNEHGTLELKSIVEDSAYSDMAHGWLIQHPGLKSVIRKCLAYAPEQRYTSAADLGDEIRRFQSDLPTRAERANLMRKLHLFYKRNRRICHTLLAGTLLIGFIVAVFIFVLRERDRRVHSARMEAIEAEQLYQQEQAHAGEVKREYSGALKFMHMQFAYVANQSAPVDAYIYHEMIRRLRIAQQLNPHDTQSMAAHAIILFILQRYNEATEVFEAAPNWAWDIRDLAAKYRHKKEDSERLHAGDLAELIRDFRARSQRPATIATIEQIARYDLNRRESLGERALIVEELIRIYNPQWLGRIFDYIPETRHLTIGGENLWFLDRRPAMTGSLKPLDWLDVHTLKLHDLKFSDLTGLEGLSVARLDLTQLKGQTLSLDVLQKFKSLGEIVVNFGQISEEMRRVIPPYVKLVERFDLNNNG